MPSNDVSVRWTSVINDFYENNAKKFRNTKW